MYLSIDFSYVDCVYVFSGSSCVLKWEDPHDSVVYCVDSDRKWMVISGTNRYGVVIKLQLLYCLSVITHLDWSGRVLLYCPLGFDAGLILSPKCDVTYRFMEN